MARILTVLALALPGSVLLDETALAFTPVHRGHPVRCDTGHKGRWPVTEVRCMIRSVWPRRLWKQAEAVARCESNFNPYDGPAIGVFQFLRSTWNSTPWRRREPTNPMHNTRAALWLYRTGGHWQQWTCGDILGFNH